MATKKSGTAKEKPVAPEKQPEPAAVAEPRPHGWKGAEVRRRAAEAEAQRKAG